MPEGITRALLGLGIAAAVLSALAGLVTGDSVFAGAAVLSALASVGLWLALRARIREGEPPLASSRASGVRRNAIVAGAAALPVVAIAVLHSWRLDSIWTVPALFVSLWMAGVCVLHVRMLLRELRTPEGAPERHADRSPADGA